MRVVFLSDTHDTHAGVKVPDGDMIVHAGDLTMNGTVRSVLEALTWFGHLPHKHKVFVAGNHDFLFEKSESTAKSFVLPGTTYLRDEAIELGGLKIYGSPVQPRFFDWAFNVDRGEAIKKYWDLIPNDLDILITHGPPMGLHDLTAPMYGSKHVGCEELLAAVQRAKPRYHVFGHIHGGYGVTECDGTMFINASVVDEYYKLANQPFVFDIEEREAL